MGSTETGLIDALGKGEAMPEISRFYGIIIALFATSTIRRTFMLDMGATKQPSKSGRCVCWKGVFRHVRWASLSSGLRSIRLS